MAPTTEKPFVSEDVAKNAAADRAARGELENETADGRTAPDVAREASTSPSTKANKEGRQIAVLKEDPAVDSAGNRMADKSDIAAFASLTGYKASDVIGSNAARRTFVTENGGKYVISKNKKNVRVASGPAYPKQREEAEEDDE